MPIRVIAGIAKGRQLKLVPGDSTRPIMDRVKESLFNIIGRDILGSTFLDLFAGTGSVGIEALSRGANRAIFIELDRKALQTVESNLKLTKLDSKATVKHYDALSYLKQSPFEVYDFIYVAPPQYKGIWIQVLHLLEAQSSWLNEQSQVIVQIDPTEEEQISLTRLEIIDKRRYGNTLLLFFGLRDVKKNK